MKKILFPTDFSNCAQNAFNYALHLAAAFNASITTAHVYHPSVPIFIPQSMSIEDLTDLQIATEFERYREAALNMHQQMEKEKLESVSVNHLLEEGFAGDVIIDIAKREKSDWIVMGTKGASGLKKFFVGSVAAKVAANAECQVLTVPDSAVYKPIKKVAYATNFEWLEEEKLGELIRLSEQIEADLHCMHISDENTYVADIKMIDFKKIFGHKKNVSFEVLKNEDVIEGLENYVKNKDIDLLVMLTHKRSYLEKLFTVSYTKDMVLQTKVPLLIIK